MLLTLFVITSARVAARSCSFPYLSTFSCAALNVTPTRVSAPTCPCMTFPIMLPILTASCVLTLTPFCCTARLFIAGIRVLSASVELRNVASCCAPDNCTSSPTTPSACCAAVSSFIDCISAGLAPIRCRIIAPSFVSASLCMFWSEVVSLIKWTAILIPWTPVYIPTNCFMRLPKPS